MDFKNFADGELLKGKLVSFYRGGGGGVRGWRKNGRGLEPSKKVCDISSCLVGWSKWMWLVSWRRQGILTQDSVLDPKCKLNISSFLTLTHPLDCLIFAKDMVIIVLLLQTMGGGRGGGR